MKIYFGKEFIDGKWRVTISYDGKPKELEKFETETLPLLDIEEPKGLIKA